MSALAAWLLPRALLLAVLAAPPLLAQDEPSPSPLRSSAGLFQLSYSSELQPLAINRIHAWTLHLRDAQGAPVAGASITVEGGMPAHQHGLPTAPRVTRDLGEGEYLLEGLRFHMGGDWELRLTIEAGGLRDTLLIPLRL